VAIGAWLSQTKDAGCRLQAVVLVRDCWGRSKVALSVHLEQVPRIALRAIRRAGNYCSAGLGHFGRRKSLSVHSDAIQGHSVEEAALPLMLEGPHSCSRRWPRPNAMMLLGKYRVAGSVCAESRNHAVQNTVLGLALMYRWPTAGRASHSILSSQALLCREPQEAYELSMVRR